MVISVVLSGSIFLSGCAGVAYKLFQSQKLDAQIQNSQNQNVQTQSVQNQNTTDQNTQDQIASSVEDYVADDMTIKSEDDAVFYMMRVNEDYIVIPGECQWVYQIDNGSYPELENGQVAKVTADIDIYYGGEAGFMGNYFIKELKSYEVCDYAAVIDDAEIPNAKKVNFDYKNHILRYRHDKKLYFIVLNRQYITVFSEGQLFMEYEYAEKEDMLQPFLEKLVGTQSEEESSTDDSALYQKFLNNEVEAYYESGVSFMFSDISNLCEDGNEIHFDEQNAYADIDNDGKLELTLWGFYGGFFIDELDGKLIVLAMGEGTADMLYYVYHGDETWLVYADTMHMGRNMRHFVKYNGEGKIVDEFDLNAEYWESEYDWYDENSLFTYNGTPITMEEYERILEEYSGR